MYWQHHNFLIFCSVYALVHLLVRNVLEVCNVRHVKLYWLLTASNFNHSDYILLICLTQSTWDCLQMGCAWCILWYRPILQAEWYGL